jgi:hypothetical protein
MTTFVCAETATVANIFLAFVPLNPPTVSEVFAAESDWTLPKQLVFGSQSSIGLDTPSQTNLSAIASLMANQDTTRATTTTEKIAGEFRRWRVLGSNWDGENATAPVDASFADAVSFVRLLNDTVLLPDPMMLASGRAGLFWQKDDLYADLEFLGAKQVAYYIERGKDKHKGVIHFDSTKMPVMFESLLKV